MKSVSTVFVASFAVAAIIIGAFVHHPLDHSRQNQLLVLEHLQNAAPLYSASKGVSHVTLKNQVNLKPDEPQELHGYIVTFRLKQQGFAITAVPKAQGETGFWSYFVDETRVIRSEYRLHSASNFIFADALVFTGGLQIFR